MNAGIQSVVFNITARRRQKSRLFCIYKRQYCCAPQTSRLEMKIRMWGMKSASYVQHNYPQYRRWSWNVLLCNSDATGNGLERRNVRKSGELSCHIWLCESIKSFTIQLFSSEALSLWNIPPETLHLFHHVYCSLFLLLTVDMFLHF